MKNLFLLMVTTFMWGTSQAQNCWTTPTHAHTQVNHVVYNSYAQQNPYMYNNPYTVQYNTPYMVQNCTTRRINDASYSLGQAIGSLVNIVVESKANKRRCRTHRVRDCRNCCR
jgi:hypothetical protein